MRRHKTKDWGLLTALASGKSVEEAARSAKMSRATAYRRMEDPDFIRELETMRSETWTRAEEQLVGNVLEAVNTAREMMEADNPPAVRLAAARSILELADRYRPVKAEPVEPETYQESCERLLRFFFDLIRGGAEANPGWRLGDHAEKHPDMRLADFAAHYGPDTVLMDLKDDLLATATIQKNNVPSPPQLKGA